MHTVFGPSLREAWYPERFANYSEPFRNGATTDEKDGRLSFDVFADDCPDMKNLTFGEMLAGVCPDESGFGRDLPNSILRRSIRGASGVVVLSFLSRGR